MNEPAVHPSTFSIVALDRENGDLGVAVQSKFLAVGAVVPWAQAGVGAVATQAWGNTAFGPEGLRLMGAGMSAVDALEQMLATDTDAGHRQVGMVDAGGRAATFTGAECSAWAGGRTGDAYACQGNILVGAATVDAMAKAFEDTQGGLWDRLVAALAAGQRAGGDRRGQQSAALLVVRDRGGYGGRNDRFIDLRVDDHPHPIVELERLLGLHKLYLFPSSGADLQPLTPATVTELQRMAAGAGCYAGALDGALSEATWAGLRSLVGIENLEERWRTDGMVDRVVLDFLRTRYSAQK
jgi:uncharacterized Ntn-hydrolase superfamily protein